MEALPGGHHAPFTIPGNSHSEFGLLRNGLKNLLIERTSPPHPNPDTRNVAEMWLKLDEPTYFELVRASQGYTRPQSCIEMRVNAKTVERLRTNILDIFMAPTIASAVGEAIARRVLPIVRRVDPGTELNETQLEILRYYRYGYQGSAIADMVGIEPQQMHRQFERIKVELTASNPPHAVRRACEDSHDIL